MWRVGASSNPRPFKGRCFDSIRLLSKPRGGIALFCTPDSDGPGKRYDISIMTHNIKQDLWDMPQNFHQNIASPFY